MVRKCHRGRHSDFAAVPQRRPTSWGPAILGVGSEAGPPGIGADGAGGLGYAPRPVPPSQVPAPSRVPASKDVAALEVATGRWGRMGP